MATEKYKILAIEDDEVLNKVYEIEIADENTEVFVALNGQEARAKFPLKPDLIILDIMLPGESGFELLKEIRKNPDTKNAIVIVVSNLSQTADMETAKNLGAQEFMTKADISVHTLAKKVKDYYDKIKAGEAAPKPAAEALSPQDEPAEAPK